MVSGSTREAMRAWKSVVDAAMRMESSALEANRDPQFFNGRSNLDSGGLT